MAKTVIYIGAALGSIVGAYVPVAALGASPLGVTSIIAGFIGAVSRDLARLPTLPVDRGIGPLRTQGECLKSLSSGLQLDPAQPAQGQTVVVPALDQHQQDAVARRAAQHGAGSVRVAVEMLGAELGDTPAAWRNGRWPPSRPRRRSAAGSPARALPSRRRCSSSISASGRSETLRLHARRLVAQPHQVARHRLDERRRAAHEDRGPLRGRPGDLGQHRLVDAPRVAGPSRRRHARERVRHLRALARRRQPFELVPVDHVRRSTATSTGDERGHCSSAAILWRSMHMSGTMPEPPATSWSGAPAVGRHTK